MKKISFNTTVKAAGLKLLQTTVSYLLLVVISFPGLSINSKAQAIEEPLKMSGNKISLQKAINPRFSKMSVQSFSALKARAAVDNSGVATEKTAQGTAKSYYVVNVEFKTADGRKAVFTDTKESKLSKAYVLTVIDRFADVFIEDESVWEAIWANPDVLKAEAATKIDVPPPPVLTPSTLTGAAVPEPIVRGGYTDSRGRLLKGKNVTIAILDTGIDFRHPDFINYDARNRPESRITYLWDTATEYVPGRGIAAPFKFPNGTSIGTLYKKEHLTAELRSDKNNIPPTDLDGHGTACASIAAGNGNADRQKGGLKRNEVEGVAPDAEIIGVRLGAQGLENGYLINAIVEWLDTISKNKNKQNKPLVISGSFGGHYRGHDGQSIEERELDARFPLNKPGRAIVFAAGNEGNNLIHAKANFSNQPQLVSWTARKKTEISIYLDSSDSGNTITGTGATPLPADFAVGVNPITNQHETRITVNPGSGGIWLENTSGRNSEAHLYFYEEDSRGFYGAFDPKNATLSHLVGSPGSTKNAITVGSYDWNDNYHHDGKVISLMAVCADSKGIRSAFQIGWLSCYSSPGPNRAASDDGKTVVKPDIVAPGEWFPSSYAKIPGKGGVDGWVVEVSPGKFEKVTGDYAPMNGTSAATPYTAGIIALMFERKPTLTLDEIKTLFKSKANKKGLNPYGQELPNNNWGYGKLDITTINAIFASL